MANRSPSWTALRPRRCSASRRRSGGSRRSRRRSTPSSRSRSGSLNREGMSGVSHSPKTGHVLLLRRRARIDIDSLHSPSPTHRSNSVGEREPDLGYCNRAPDRQRRFTFMMHTSHKLTHKRVGTKTEGNHRLYMQEESEWARGFLSTLRGRVRPSGSSSWCASSPTGSRSAHLQRSR